MGIKRSLIKDPGGNLFNVAEAHSVKLVSNGIMIVGP